MQQSLTIARTLADVILQSMRPGFVNILYGPRQIGKTVLLGQITAQLSKEKILAVNGDTEEGRTLLSTTSEVKLAQTMKNYTILCIDEAQRISNIGLSLKIIIDRFPSTKIMVTGSSSLDLAKGIKENLTGRNKVFLLYPLATGERAGNLGVHHIPSLLEEQLIYGGYPYVQSLAAAKEKQEYLAGIVEDYLFRDIVWLEKIENPDVLRKLSTVLAFQIGSEVSLNELSRTLGIDVKTVARYLALLEKSFVIVPIGAYAKNLRNEISKSKKYYFFDLGIRNALTSQFLPLDRRTDIGALWENFLFIERMKERHYARTVAQYYFWRTYEGAEVDMVELIAAEKLRAFEFKWGLRTWKAPTQFTSAYDADIQIITKDNYLDFVGAGITR